MERILISQSGYKKVKQELENLKKERPEVIQAIKEAREEGDLSENAGYDAARERQGILEARINNIEYRMGAFEVIDLDTMQGNKVAFGATVELENIDTAEKKTYTILGEDEADFTKGSISILSPFARAILGKEEGDEVTIDVAKGKMEYEILSIRYLGEKAAQQLL